MKNSIIIITSVLLLLFSFLVFTGVSPFVKGYSKIKATVGETTGPLLKLVDLPVRYIKIFFNSYINLVGVKRENEELKKKIDQLELENQKLVELEKENTRLKSILNIMNKNPQKMVAANVIGEDLKNLFKCIIIDKGRDSGLKERMPVITPRGVVGQAVEIGRGHAKVLVLNDTNSSIDVYVEGKNTRGIAEGTGGSKLKLKYILKNDDLALGDKLITSGKDGIFPKGLPVGMVVEIDRKKPGIFAEVDVMPFNNYKRVDEVLIIKRQ
ncbi:MAG: rod shape-determining protein MreC [Syntrophorhabdaceae bacterium]|nr:rod shape-determining protein MreC [Syntrophorhabdaceae bacterium]